MKYLIGLDIGIASIGWAVINDEKKRIEDLGVRLFPSAERPKDGGPLNEERRLLRGLRRRLKRKRIRMNKIKSLFLKYNILNREELDKLYILDSKDIDTWVLRAEGLNRCLSSREWARVLTAIAKRRGFKSNRKALEEKEEGGKLLTSIKLNRSYMENKGYRTIGEMFAKDEKYAQNKRNKGSEYLNCIERKDLEEEVSILFEVQRNFGNMNASKQFEDEYLQVFKWQKNFITPELMEKMVGKCTFEKDEPRASKNSYTFERFMLLQKVNNLSYQIKGDKFELNREEKNKIIKLAYEIKSGVKYSRIRKDLNLPEEAVFVGLNYYLPKKKNEDKDVSMEELRNQIENKVFVNLKGYHDIKKAFLDANEINVFESLLESMDILDSIAEILTRNKTDVEITNELLKIGLTQNVIEKMLNINYTKFGHLSYKAMKNILPFLEEGYKYDKASEMAGYNFKNDDSNPSYKLPVIPKDEIRNPVVYRAISQTRKVINSIIDKYGSPFEIHIEVARELTKSHEERQKIEHRQNENKALNDTLKKDIEEHFNIRAKAVDMLKVKLYREQTGKSMYSMKPIDYNRLFEEGYVEIDHAIPFSRSFDDSYNNKVLVLTKENQEKRNMTPHEYLGNTAIWENFESFAKDIYKRNSRKLENILAKNFNEDKENNFIQRNLNDTKYIARYMANFIKKNLKFENFEKEDNRNKVIMMSGAATTALRHYFGISAKDRENNNLHHAEDAVIIASATNENQNKIREYSKEKDLYYPNKNGEYYDPKTGEIVDVKYRDHKMARPWPEFKEELEARLSINPVYDLKHGEFYNYNDIDIEKIKPVFISRMPNRKISGKAHKDTIFSEKLKKQGKNLVTVKKPLCKISKEEIKEIIQNAEYKNIYISDKDLYDRIYARMAEYDFKAEKAFPANYVLRKKSKSGEGPIVRSIKVPSVINSEGVHVQGGIAENANMVRVDVFEKNNKFYLVPIYVRDMLEENLPNKAIKAHKSESEWIIMDNTYNFKFSLYSNDMVAVKKKDEDIVYGYYISTHRGAGTIKVLPNRGKKGKDEIDFGAQKLEIFEKYNVDVLGNYYKVKNEKRKGGKFSKK